MRQENDSPGTVLAFDRLVERQWSRLICRGQYLAPGSASDCLFVRLVRKVIRQGLPLSVNSTGSASIMQGHSEFRTAAP